MKGQGVSVRCGRFLRIGSSSGSARLVCLSTESQLCRLARLSPISHTRLESDFRHENATLERNGAGIVGLDKRTAEFELELCLDFQVSIITSRGPAWFYFSRLWLFQTATSPDESPDSKGVSSSHNKCSRSPRKHFLCAFEGLWALGCGQESSDQHLAKEGDLKTCPGGQTLHPGQEKGPRLLALDRAWELNPAEAQLTDPFHRGS